MRSNVKEVQCVSQGVLIQEHFKRLPVNERSHNRVLMCFR